MSPLITLFLIIYGIERVLETFRRRNTIPGQIVAAYTLSLLVSAHVFLYSVVLWEWFARSSREVSGWVTLAGCLMIGVSVAARQWAIKTLGPYHSIHIEIRDRHELIRSGPYRFVRNPYYLSNAVEVLGLPLVANAWAALLVSVFVYLPLLGLRLMMEESEMEKKFAVAFSEYKKKVPRIIPTLTV